MLDAGLSQFTDMLGLDPLAGLCQFSRTADEFRGGEICQAEIIVTFGNGAVLILPTRGYYTLTIEDSLA